MTFLRKIGFTSVFTLPDREFLDRMGFGDDGNSLPLLLHFEPLFLRVKSEFILSAADNLLLLPVGALVNSLS